MSDEDRVIRAVTRAQREREYADWVSAGLSEGALIVRDVAIDSRAAIAEDIAWIMQRLTGYMGSDNHDQDA